MISALILIILEVAKIYVMSHWCDYSIFPLVLVNIEFILLKWKKHAYRRHLNCNAEKYLLFRTIFQFKESNLQI